MSTLARRNSSIHKIREYTLRKINLEDEYEVLHVMQEGWRGRLLLVEHKRTRNEVVLKAIHKESTSKMEFFREFHYNYYLSPHTNILNAYDVAFQAGEYYVFAQEYAPFGDLTSNLTETGLGETNVKRIAPQIVSALEFMHSKDLVHRNINMDNVLVFNIDFSEVKLCDFGSTRRIGSLMKKKTVSLPYAPPEIVDTVQNEGFHVSQKQDVWQLGVLLYILLTGALPWQKADVTDPHYLEFIHWKKRKTLKTPKRFSNFTARALRMFKRLLEPKPDKRSNVREVNKYLEDKWLVRPMKRQENDMDNQSVCYSTFSIHSSKVEKDRVLHALKAHGIETTVDRIAKRKRIHEWIQNSLTNNLMFDEGEGENVDKIGQEDQQRNINENNRNSGSYVLYSNLISGLKIPDEDERIRLAEEKKIFDMKPKESRGSITYEHALNQNKVIDFPNLTSTQNLNDNNIPAKPVNAYIKDLVFSDSQSPVRGSANVKRTSSLQEKSRNQDTSETPCNNYKEIHSSRTHYYQSPTRNPLSHLSGHSKTRKPPHKTVGNSNTRNISNSNDVHSPTEERSRPIRKSPVLGRSAAHRNRHQLSQRSKSLARNPTSEVAIHKPQQISPLERELANPSPSKRRDSDGSETTSNDSLTSVIPVVYYL